MDAAIERFQKVLKVEGMQKSSVLKVSFRHKDPLIAADAVNRLIDFYKENIFRFSVIQNLHSWRRNLLIMTGN